MPAGTAGWLHTLRVLRVRGAGNHALATKHHATLTPHHRLVVSPPLPAAPAARIATINLHKRLHKMCVRYRLAGGCARARAPAQ